MSIIYCLCWQDQLHLDTSNPLADNSFVRNTRISPFLNSSEWLMLQVCPGHQLCSLHPVIFVLCGFQYRLYIARKLICHPKIATSSWQNQLKIQVADHWCCCLIARGSLAIYNWPGLVVARCHWDRLMKCRMLWLLGILQNHISTSFQWCCCVKCPNALNQLHSRHNFSWNLASDEIVEEINDCRISTEWQDNCRKPPSELVIG